MLNNQNSKTKQNKTNSAERLTKLWEETLKQLSGSAELWQDYLSFRLSSFANFTVAAVREVYCSAIQALRSAQNVKGTFLNTISPLQ